MPGFRHFAMVVAALAVLVGCTEIENPRTLAPGEPDVPETRSSELQRAQFDDVPVPPGYTYVTRGNRSFSFSRGGVRVGRFVYWGRTGVEEVAAFYRRNMGLRAYDWTLVGEDTGPVETVLKYRKDQIDCNVTITREAGSTYIRIDVAGPA